MKRIAASIALTAALCASIASANNCAMIVNGDMYSGKGSSFAARSWTGTGLSASFSVGMWVKNVTAQYHVFCFKWSQAGLYCPSSHDGLRFYTTQTNVAEQASVDVVLEVAKGRDTLNDGRWHFLCCTFSYDSSDSSRSFQRLYIDGTVVGEQTGAAIVGPLVDAGTKPLSIFGEYAEGNGFWYNNFRAATGALSEMTIWNRALTTAEVERLCQFRVGGRESGLMFWWPCTGDDATSLKNLVVGGATMTLAVSSNGASMEMADDDTFPLANCRCVASPAWVAEHGYVPSAGATFRDWTEPATSISDALAAALPFETVHVMSGTYEIDETLFLTNGQRLVSYNPTTGLPDRAGTILDGQGERRVVTVQSGKDEGTELSGFTIRNGNNSGGDGGGAYLSGDASSLANLAKRSRISDCIFENCSASNGGGVCIYGGYVTNCTFRNCTAAVSGGGIGVCRFKNVTSFNAYNERHNTPCVYDCDFDTCEAGLRGGAVSDTGGNLWNTFILENCRSTDCRTNGSGKRSGGHVYAGAGSFILGSTFTGVSGATYGDCISGSWLTISNCTIRGITQGGGYGTVCLAGNGSFRVCDCVVTNNSSTASLFMLFGGSAAFRNVLCTDNSNAEAVVRMHPGLYATIENCTFVGKGSESSIVMSSESPSRYSAVNSILWNGKSDGWSDSNRNCLTNCCVMSRSGADAEDVGVITDAPKFVDAAHGDYSLKHNSPCRDRGMILDWMSVDAVDLLGNPRVVRDGRPLAEDPAALPDIGCYECMLPHVGLMLLVF